MSHAKITVLVDDTAGGRGLLAEHGLAFWLALPSGNVLFDTGQGMVLRHNAERLGMDLASTDAVALSHGHYDHTGGLAGVLDAAPDAAVHACPDSLDPKYARNADGSGRDVGMARNLAGRLNECETLHRVTGPTEILPGLWLTGPIPRTTDFEDTGGEFFTDADCTRPDALTDDQAAFFDGADGTVVVLGCAHAGVINTLRYVRELTGRRAIHTVLGGMHLLHAGPGRLGPTIDALQALDIARMLPCHCTGFGATAQLAAAFPHAISPCRVGTVVETPTRPGS
jgi:7,8-dihydropterin-6-yl-methyl-4-(beta-D-ribofuranosyl)aminobenzene 5'-phosphate synthase